MTIHFYLNNDKETEITTFYDMVSNPFNVGDVINLEVEEICPKDLLKYKEAFRYNLELKNDDKRKMVNRKCVKIVREGKYVSFNAVIAPKLTIEYHCEFVS